MNARSRGRAWLGGAVVTALGLTGIRTPPTDAASVSCILTPELTEGAYYIAGEKLRRNITEGRPGSALALRTFVVDARTCRPIRNAAVDIWHADAGGVYSGFGAGASNRTFMRAGSRHAQRERHDLSRRRQQVGRASHAKQRRCLRRDDRHGRAP